MSEKVEQQQESPLGARFSKDASDIFAQWGGLDLTGGPTEDEAADQNAERQDEREAEPPQ